VYTVQTHHLRQTRTMKRSLSTGNTNKKALTALTSLIHVLTEYIYCYWSPAWNTHHCHCHFHHWV